GVADGVVAVAGVLDAQQRPVADARDLARPRAPYRLDADLRWRPVRLLVPFGRHRDELAVAVALADVGDHDVRQAARLVQLLAPPLDAAFLRQLLQGHLKRPAVGVLQVEGARDLPGADLAGWLTCDEGEDLFPEREGGRGGRGSFHETDNMRAPAR